MLRQKKLVIMVVTIVTLAAFGQQGRWAAPGDPTAKFMIDAERQWAEAACTHNKIAQQILADDFQGTSTAGERYGKSQEVSDMADTSKSAHDCRLLDAKVRFFGDSIALIYGSETSVRKSKDGKDERRCQIWTDTWLKRNGKWQIVAAQDGPIPCK